MFLVIFIVANILRSSKKELSANIVDGFKPLTIFAKSCTLGDWKYSGKYLKSEVVDDICLKWVNPF